MSMCAFQKEANMALRFQLCELLLPWQTGCVPLQVPLLWQVLSAEPIRLYPASQLKRSKLLVLNSSPPSRAPWGGTPGSPHTPGLIPI